MISEQDALRLAAMCADPGDFRVDIPTAGSPSSGLVFKIIPEGSQSAIIPDRKAQLLRKIGNAQAEIGRLNKLLNEIRVGVLTTD